MVVDSTYKAGRLLADVLRWRYTIVPYQPDVHSVPTGNPSFSRERAPQSLPFELDRVIDTAVDEGPAGVTSSEGVSVVVSELADRYQELMDAEVSGTPSAWLLNELQTGAAQNILDQQVLAVEDGDISAYEFLSLWDQFMRVLRRLHYQTAILTGNAPESRGRCPRCVYGVLISSPGKDGFSDEAKCSRPDCGFVINTYIEETNRLYLRILRSVDHPGVGVSVADIRVIWPGLHTGTLRTWVHRGLVNKVCGKYDLAEVNQRMTKSEGTNL